MNLFKNLFGHHPSAETVIAPDSCTWPGESGTEYQYQVYPLDAEFRPLPGNYIYAGQDAEGRWLPVYVSQTRDLHQRLEGHIRTSDAVAKGATHLHAHYCAAGQATRCGEERDLIKQWQPVCNEVLES